ncbi:MAG: ISNCY family transposase [Pseudomonadales bacterium]|nr:ISNCY family transposase [Pseudomonadales bacterium]
MRETRTAQTSIFDFYSKHERGLQLEKLSNLLDEYPEVLDLLENDFIGSCDPSTGRRAMTIESVFRCMLLKQMLSISYELLSFYLSDSLSYRTFSRIEVGDSPSKSTLQSNIRRIRPITLCAVFDLLAQRGFEVGNIDPDLIRIDSTVVKSNIAAPIDSQLLDDGIRVLSRYLAKSKNVTGIKTRFKDFRKTSKSLAFRIFNAKKAEKDELYPDLLILSNMVVKQVDKAIEKVKDSNNTTTQVLSWLEEIENYRNIMLMVIDQTERRIIEEENVPSNEKVVSFFELHTDIIVKDKREVQYGHKINIASDARGLLTHVSVEEGNASDAERFIPILKAHAQRYDCMPTTVVSDGGYASKKNVEDGNKLGVKRVVFHKKRGINLNDMGVKQKKYDALKNFRAGVEGNISELKRAFGLGKALWKGYEGFHAYVWASAITYNLVRLVRIDTD